MGIVLYQDRDFGGLSTEIVAGYFDLCTVPDNIGVQAKQLSSYIIGPWTNVSFFPSPELGIFASLKWSDHNPSPGFKEVPYIGDEYNDDIIAVSVSSIPIPSFGEVVPDRPAKTPNLRGVIVYEDWKFNAESNTLRTLFLGNVRSQHFDVGTYDLPFDPAWDPSNPSPRLVFAVRPTMVSSIKVGTGYYATIYDGPSGTGNALEINQNLDILKPEWNDRAMSLMVSKVPIPG
jgi:hypothetical protein